MSESALGEASSNSDASDKGVTCSVCGKQCKSEHGLKIHNAQAHDGHNKLRDPDWLWQKRWVEGKEQREIAEIADVSHPAVGYQLRKHGISGTIHPYIDDPEILHDLYIRRDMSVYEICDEFNVDKSTVSERAKTYGISKKVHRANVKGVMWAIPFIKEKYHHDMWTIPKIADELNVTSSTVTQAMQKYDIETRDQSYYSGENNPNWKEGHIPSHYGGDWGVQRKKARERDNHTCQRCGKTKEDIGRAISVHHKVPYRNFDDAQKANKLDNLICLCDTCHPQVEKWPVQPQ
jgi:predicted DNA-binding protein YlxM (UPF0122 family)